MAGQQSVRGYGGREHQTEGGQAVEARPQLAVQVWGEAGSEGGPLGSGVRGLEARSDRGPLGSGVTAHAEAIQSTGLELLAVPLHCHYWTTMLPASLATTLQLELLMWQEVQ